MMERRDSATLFLVGITAVALYLCYLLIRPYATPILFASVIAIIFYPLHRRTQQMVGDRNLSAAISTAVTLILTVVPLTFLLVAISHELSDLYQSLVTKSADSGGGCLFAPRRGANRQLGIKSAGSAFTRPARYSGTET